MSAVDTVLYKWIVGANDRRETLVLAPGVIEDSIGLLRDLLGIDFLHGILVSSSAPICIFDPDVNPLRMWLYSSAVDQHIIQVLEFAAYLRIFKDDQALIDKIEKLKRDRFWPIVFELAMAARMKRACQPSQTVALKRELPDSIGDFVLEVGGMATPCECSRLGYSPQVNEPYILAEHLSKRIADATKRISVPLVFKVRSADPLNGSTYNLMLKLLRRCLSDVKRLRLPTVHYEGQTSICCGELTASSERIPFRMIDGVVTNIDGTDWDTAQSLQRVPAVDEEELTTRFKAGERFRQFEAVRIFMKFGASSAGSDYYDRLANKLRKKLKQTKISAGDYGKLVFIEVPFDLRLADEQKLHKAIADAVQHSRTTLGVILAHREANPHRRYHYSLYAMLNEVAVTLRSELLSLFERFQHMDSRTDPLSGLPYAMPWEEARVRVQTEKRKEASE